MDLYDLNETETFYKPKIGEDCPECEDGKLVERRYKDKDTLKIKTFIGCSNYPRCEFSQFN